MNRVLARTIFVRFSRYRDPENCHNNRVIYRRQLHFVSTWAPLHELSLQHSLISTRFETEKKKTILLLQLSIVLGCFVIFSLLVSNNNIINNNMSWFGGGNSKDEPAEKSFDMGDSSSMADSVPLGGGGGLADIQQFGAQREWCVVVSSFGRNCSSKQHSKNCLDLFFPWFLSSSCTPTAHTYCFCFHCQNLPARLLIYPKQRIIMIIFQQSNNNF